MARRQTGIGFLVAYEPRKAHAELIEVVQRNRGFVAKAAHDLCISRRQLYRILDRANLWDVVDAARAKRRRNQIPDEIRRARLLLEA